MRILIFGAHVRSLRGLNYGNQINSPDLGPSERVSAGSPSPLLPPRLLHEFAFALVGSPWGRLGATSCSIIRALRSREPNLPQQILRGNGHFHETIVLRPTREPQNALFVFMFSLFGRRCRVGFNTLRPKNLEKTVCPIAAPLPRRRPTTNPTPRRTILTHIGEARGPPSVTWGLFGAPLGASELACDAISPPGSGQQEGKQEAMRRKGASTSSLVRRKDIVDEIVGRIHDMK